MPMNLKCEDEAKLYVGLSEGGVLIDVMIDRPGDGTYQIVSLLPDEARELAERLTEYAHDADEEAGEYGT